MRIVANRAELLEMLGRHSADAEGMAGTLHPDEMEEARLRIRLEHRLLHKALQQVTTVSVDYGGDDDDIEPREEPARGSRRDRILRWFQDRPEQTIRPRDLMRGLEDWNASAIGVALKRLVEEGYLTRIGRGKYRLSVDFIGRESGDGKVR